MEQVKQEPYCKTDRLSRWKGIRLLIRWVLGRRALLLFHWRRDINFIIARISRVPMCEVLMRTENPSVLFWVFKFHRPSEAAIFMDYLVALRC